MLLQLHNRLMASPLTRPVQRRLVRTAMRAVGRPDAYDDLARVCRKVNPAAVLDIGSHEGYTVDRFLEGRRGETIHAFEPAPGAREVLRRRMARHPNVHVHPFAVGDRTGRLELFLNAGSVTNSLLENAGGEDRPFGELQRHVGILDVDGVRLDDWVPEHVPTGPLVVKADIQGAELLLVEGAREILDTRVAAFYTEVCLLPLYDGQASFGELNDLLTKDLGLALHTIYHCGRDSLGRAAWTDALWVRPDWVLPL